MTNTANGFAKRVGCSAGDVRKLVFPFWDAINPPCNPCLRMQLQWEAKDAVGKFFPLLTGPCLMCVEPSPGCRDPGAYWDAGGHLSHVPGSTTPPDAHHVSWFSSSVKEEKSCTEPDQTSKQPQTEDGQWSPQISSWWLAILDISGPWMWHWLTCQHGRNIVLLSGERWRALGPGHHRWSPAESTVWVPPWQSVLGGTPAVQMLDHENKPRQNGAESEPE